MNTGLTTQEQIALAKEILQVKNRRERSLKSEFTVTSSDLMTRTFKKWLLQS